MASRIRLRILDDMYSDILFEVDGAIARVTLNKPDKRNPLGPRTILTARCAAGLARISACRAGSFSAATAAASACFRNSGSEKNGGVDS